jgi:LysM repeat protein
MGFLDDLKKNLGLGNKDAESPPRPVGEAAANVTSSPGGTSSADVPGGSFGDAAAVAPAEPSEAETIPQEDAAAARVTAQRQAADESAAAQQAAAAQAAADAVANRQPDSQPMDVPPVAEAVVEPVAEPELAEPVLAEPVLTEPVGLDEASTVSEVAVEPGDTMQGIATQYGVDLDELIAANADTVPNPDHIYPGQVLRLP